MSEKESNIIHQNAIFSEMAKKLQQTQKYSNNFVINPFSKTYANGIISSKPGSAHDSVEATGIDEHFLDLILRAAQAPKKKYNFPLTESQEIGWNTEPLIHVNSSIVDKKLNFPRKSTEITQYSAAMLKMQAEAKTSK